ncbi:MAG TPA: nucleotide exchange factor GrpE [Candidatus Sulfomarinibacteraceae bacterium]|nr:nucleotide exchange factor GrpE [Candidatus Sulfomarinibacteraceae bacterium]
MEKQDLNQEAEQEKVDVQVDVVDETAGEEAAEEEGKEPSLEERLQEAEAQAAEYLEGWQRARAEFANARKRLERERSEARRNATVDVVSKLLPVMDDFERALENVPEHIGEDSWFEGVALVYRKLASILEETQIERIKAVGQPFDPNVHEAVLQEESDDHESGTVIKELQSGYRLNERVIRPAMVVVAA